MSAPEPKQVLEEFRLVGGPYAEEYLTLPATTEATIVFIVQDKNGRKRKGRYIRLGVPHCLCKDDNNLMYWDPK